jgi:hypothetical protein
MTTNLIPSSNGALVIKYGIHHRDSRRLLSSHLKQVISRAYKFLHRDCYRLTEERDYLNEAVGLLSKEKDGTLLVRQQDIQDCIYEFFDLMEELRSYADNSARSSGRSTSIERKLSKALRKFIAKMNSRTNIRLNSTETEILKAINLQGDVKVFYINLRRISEAFQPIFQGQYATTSEPEDLTNEQIRLNLLNQLSPALAAAYEETGSLLTEATALRNTPEDEYFIDEVTKDYYLHIFENLHNISKESVDFAQKEAVVTESLKQFQIIQLGLNKIIENSIANSMNLMKSQTDFLRNKIIGSRAFNLSPSELEQEVQTSVEQSQQLREELYQKHVAPRIEQNRLEYEAKLAAMQAENETEMAAMQARYETHIKNLEEDTLSLRSHYEEEQKYIVVQNKEYRDRIRKLELELAQRGTVSSHYPAPNFTIPKETVEPAATISVAPMRTDRIDVPTLLTDRINIGPAGRDSSDSSDHPETQYTAARWINPNYRNRG